ncbi:MAG: hypothetical protein A2622_01445 [Bdellovibrionales bacterium RIFCSPHIGHO2_01_FULL_40_29]|nr:MAG: hypothetical protein A2622_01445 [Bdellovibrionales bacterium RIFCSPHIGHO2_01_FULL_40_29]OFZ32769.1 MAG: hypothetical protein A3D17_06045 [Bdellovibrionales bacterium RIFCSPHIGHO2_02_FULL_40_15]
MVFNDSQNITKAAEILGITQPALSKQLKALEAKFPQPIFSTQGRRKILTFFGRDLQNRIKGQIGNIQESIQESLLLHSDMKQVKIRVSGRQGVLDRISKKLEFQGTLIFNESSNQQVIDDLLCMRAEIGIAHDFPNSFNLVAKPLFKEEFKLVIPKKFLLKSKKYGKSLFEELKLSPCIGFKAEDEILNQLCTDNSISKSQLQMSRITSNYSSVAKMVDAGFGWAVIPSYLEVDLKRNWSIPVPLEVLTSRKFSILYRHEFSKTPWFNDIIKEIKGIFGS